MDPDVPAATAATRLVPVLSLRDLCLFPGAVLTLTVEGPAAAAAVDLAARCGGPLLVLGGREGGRARELHDIGTLATVRECPPLGPLGRRVELEGTARVRVAALIGTDVLVAEVSSLDEGDAGEEWGPAVEALARYLHAHPELRAFLDGQRRSAGPTTWVSLACQHLPITPSARQKLLECSARERCAKISRGLDALLRKEGRD